jgi:hypothetical protein
MPRLLLALVHARLEQPGRPLRVTELLEAGWPGERMIEEAARNRLRVMVNRLRDLGLRDVLRAEGHGYVLDPELEVQLVAAASGALGARAHRRRNRPLLGSAA